MPKINSSSVKICESSRPRLAQKFSIVTRAVVTLPIRQGVNCTGDCIYRIDRGLRDS